jgi:hypothetical protein
VNLVVRISLLGIVSVVVLASALVHPSGPVKNADSGRVLLAGADVDPAVFKVLERSCQNCHSEKTEWPWYSNIAPMSWLVESDVSQARGHMNFSRWDDYTAEQKQEILARMGTVVRGRQMPPGRYTLVHPTAKLSVVEREQIYVWAHTERRRVKSATSGAESLMRGFRRDAVFSRGKSLNVFNGLPRASMVN